MLRLAQFEATSLQALLRLTCVSLQLGIAAQMCLAARHQFPGTERLRQVVVRTEAEAADLIHVRLPGRNEYDGYIRLLPQGAANGKAILPRQHEVEHHEVIAARERCFLPAPAIRLDGRGETRRLEIIPLQLGDIDIIFHDKNFLHTHFFSRLSCQGKVITILRPPSGTCSARTLPCMASMIWRTMARPRPLPPATLTRALSVR